MCVLRVYEGFKMGRWEGLSKKAKFLKRAVHNMSELLFEKAIWNLNSSIYSNRFNNNKIM